MLNVIRKDLLINSKFLWFAVVYSIFMPILLYIDGDQKYWMLGVLLPLVNVGLVVGKSCYVEDSDEVQVFLKALPVSYSIQVISRYLEVVVILLLTMSYAIIIESYILQINTLIDSIRTNSWITCGFLLYFSLYLYLYYRKNFFYAQNSVIVLIAVIFTGYFILENLFQVESLDVNSVLSTILAPVICLLIFIVSCMLSFRTSRR